MHEFRGRTWFVVVMLSFFSLLTTAIIIIIGVMLMHRANILIVTPIKRFALILLIISSVCLGTLIFAIFSRTMVRRIRQLSRATQQLSKGDFSVQIEEDGNDSEMGLLIRDFNRMVRELRGMETLRNDFVMNVSHELKTPISSIEGCATLLQSDSLTEEERKEYTRLIADSSRRLSVLISNMLHLSKLETQEIATEQTTFALDEQIRQAILLLEPQWMEKNIAFDISLDPVSIFATEDLFMQIWTNLIGNAIKFSDPSSEITVTLRTVGEKAIVTIQDHGEGMTEDVMEHIFDKFYQGDPSRSSLGNGLGLPLVKTIVKLFDGELSVRSTPGLGSTFTVAFKNKPATDRKLKFQKSES